MDEMFPHTEACKIRWIVRIIAQIGYLNNQKYNGAPTIPCRFQPRTLSGLAVLPLDAPDATT
jgi:hypothetical protein